MTTVSDRVAAGAVTKVSVTQGHIDHGQRCHTGACPIALALLDALTLPDGHGVAVEHDRALTGLMDEDRAYIADIVLQAPLPAEAQQFIETFDNEQGAEPGPVEPFEFELTWQEAPE